MKTICVAFVLFVAVQAVSEEQKDKINENRKACADETGISMDVVEKMKSKDFSYSDPKIPEFSACVMKKFGILDNSGKFHKEVIIQMVDDDDKQTVTDALDKCLAKIGSVTEDNAYEVCKCMHSSLPEDMII